MVMLFFDVLNSFVLTFSIFPDSGGVEEACPL